MTNVVGIALDANILKSLQRAAQEPTSNFSEAFAGSQGYTFALNSGDMANFDAAGHAQSGTITQFEAIQGDRVTLDWFNLNVDAGKFWAAVNTGNVDAVGSLVFSGADSFDIFGSINGAPAPVYNGYDGNDVFHLNKSLANQAVILKGGAGDDVFNLDNNFNPATQQIDGGAGFDKIVLTGSATPSLTMTANAMVNVEELQLTNHFNYVITMNDNNVASGQTLIVDASAVVGSLSFDGHQESNGSFNILGTSRADILIGGRGADTLNGDGGADVLTGGQGADRFVFTNSFPVAGAFGHPTVTDFAAAGTAHDVIQFDAATFADFATLQQSMAQVGADVVITLDANDSVTLQNVSLASLSAQDFLFV